jgi:putative transposase
MKACWTIPATYYAHRSREMSARARRDARLLVVIELVHRHRDLGRGLAGARKVWRLLTRQAALGPAAKVVIDADLGPAARCNVERLMAQAGLSGVRRGGPKVVTTRRDESALRPADLVDRRFCAEAPNRLWIVLCRPSECADVAGGDAGQRRC